MTEDVNPLAPAEDAEQEEASPQLPAWAVKPDAARIGAAPDEAEQSPEAESGEASTEAPVGAAPEAAEYEWPRTHNQVSQTFNQGS